MDRDLPQLVEQLRYLLTGAGANTESSGQTSVSIGAKLSNGVARNLLLLAITVLTGANLFAPAKTAQPVPAPPEVINELKHVREELQQLRHEIATPSETEERQVKATTELINLLKQQQRQRRSRSRDPEEINQLRAGKPEEIGAITTQNSLGFEVWPRWEIP